MLLQGSENIKQQTQMQSQKAELGSSKDLLHKTQNAKSKTQAYRE